MGLGSSLFLIAVGAVLRFAVTVTTNGVDLRTVGLILLIIGGVGLLISLFWMTTSRGRTAVVQGDPLDGGPVRDPQPRY
jgi:hypothetical protein